MADALASGASVRKDVGVQVPPRAPWHRQFSMGTADFEEGGTHVKSRLERLPCSEDKRNTSSCCFY
jgi:hypothetical protein